jgi:hypothetical protein
MSAQPPRLPDPQLDLEALFLFGKRRLEAVLI